MPEAGGRRRPSDALMDEVYFVCRDRTLVEAVRLRPATLEELAQLHGVGPAFLSRHGASFLATLRVALAAEDGAATRSRPAHLVY